MKASSSHMKKKKKEENPHRSVVWAPSLHATSFAYRIEQMELLIQIHNFAFLLPPWRSIRFRCPIRCMLFPLTALFVLAGNWIRTSTHTHSLFLRAKQGAAAPSPSFSFLQKSIFSLRLSFLCCLIMHLLFFVCNKFK